MIMLKISISLIFYGISGAFAIWGLGIKLHSFIDVLMYMGLLMSFTIASKLIDSAQNER